jgi:ribonuclease D
VHPLADATPPGATSDASDEPELPLLREPAGGVPDPLITSEELAALVARMRRGAGPVAIDAERASGYRYSQRAYLVQLRRDGVGNVLIDPIALPALTQLNEAIGPAEWIVHAASQDLPCLSELGLRPATIFDTELAGRLLGSERVALGTMVEQYLGVRLEKGHSAADWSRRPLPHDWLAYAALDVELLIRLRDALAERLEAAGKTEWARQEFEAVRVAPATAPRAEPWRRTSGIHRVHTRRQLAVVRALWYARDSFAAQRDIAPGRVLRDQAIVEAARIGAATPTRLATVPGFAGPRQRRQLARWTAAIDAARALPDEALPTATGPPGDNLPPTSRWADRQPEALGRLTRLRAVVAELAERHQVLAQNLLASDAVRRLAWDPPDRAAPAAVAERLIELGARPWQVALTAVPLAEALSADRRR